MPVDGGVADAEVVGEAAEEEAGESAFAEVAGESGGSVVVVLEEGGVAVDVGAEAFAEDELGVGDVEGWVEGCAGGVLEAVIGPEGLGSVRGLDGVVGLLLVRGGEGDVVGGVPVLGENDVVESLGEGVDGGHDVVGAGDGERSADAVEGRAEVVLEIDDEEGVGWLEVHAELMVVERWLRMLGFDFARDGR